MVYGYRSRTRKVSAGSYRRRRYTSGATSKRVSRVPRRTRSIAKFATVGYRRDVEMKYSDKAMVGRGGDALITGPGLGGWVCTSTTWNPATFVGTVPIERSNVQDLLKGVPQGVTATSRIGNKIKVKSLKVKCTLTANVTVNSATGFENAQFGEAIRDGVEGQLIQYMRTTFRVLVIKDLQVNSTDDNITYNDVMESDSQTGFAGVHSELKIATMGRFRVMSDKLYTLDADDPMKTVAYNFYNIGSVRYNGPDALPLFGQSALTDHGIYVVWATYSQGRSNDLPIIATSVAVSRRLCFTDM